MAIRFSDLVRKAKEKFEGKRRSSTVAPLPTVDGKPQSDKLAKRVMPNAVRTMTPEPTAAALAAASVIAARRISLNRPSLGVGDDLEARPAVLVEPRGERAVSLALSDVIAAMPDGYLKKGENFDARRRVTLKAVDVEKGLATGRPSIPMAAIYQQVPEIFEHTVVPSDDTVVVLPFQKVIDELSHLRVREDQTAETLAAQVDTPFLKLMVEESARFGTKVEPFETTELFLPGEPVTSTRPGAEGGAVGGIRPTPPAPPTQPPPVPKPSIAFPVVQPAPTAKTPIAPAPIPEPQIATESSHDGSMARITPATPADADKNKPLPIGTGGSAFPRVPASSGPPVPSAPSSIATPSAVPTRIPFQLPPDVPPGVAIEKPAPSVPAVPEVPTSPPAPPVPQLSAVVAPPAVPTSEPMVVLALRPILQSLPPIQVAGDVATVPADAKISFRMSSIAPQLASGKVAITPKDFHAALPEQFRGLFLPDAVEASVQLSLPDVLANLPGDSLRMREDQEVIAQDEMFETPFLAKAKEDAQRFAETAKTSAAMRPKVTAFKVDPPKVQVPETAKADVARPNLQVPRVEGPKVEERKVEVSGRSDPLEASLSPTASTQAPGVQPAVERAKFDAKAAIAQACALSCVSACSVNFADGLIIAGNIPAEMHIEGLSAVAPTMLNKLQKHMCETQLGPLTCMTVHGEKSRVTFFSAGNLCLTAVHNGAELDAESRRELGRITQQLSHTYPQTEAPHVDH